MFAVYPLCETNSLPSSPYTDQVLFWERHVCRIACSVSLSSKGRLLDERFAEAGNGCSDLSSVYQITRWDSAKHFGSNHIAEYTKIFSEADVGR